MLGTMFVEHPRRQLGGPAFLSIAAHVVRSAALYEWVLLTYLLVLLASAVLGSGEARLRCIACLSTMLVAHVAAVTWARTSNTPASSVVHRLVIYGNVQASYFVLRDLVEVAPLARGRVVDGALHRLDLALFGVEPSAYLDRFVTPFATEWLSAFYLAYFAIVALHLLPMLARDHELLPELGLGLLGLFCVAQATYLVVPGFGPVKALAFQNALPHGPIYDLMIRTVDAGGAQKDIFPSLHTAAPTFLALFSFRHRARLPFRYTWPIVAFAAANIVAATLYLRWHWLIDVVAGLALAITASVVAPALTAWESKRRKQLATGRSWPTLLPAKH